MTNGKSKVTKQTATVGVVDVIDCRLCPRLVEWRERVAREKRAAFEDQEYWGRPVPSLGDPDAPVLIVGLAPAAHGGNRTGRMFTGDRSGDFLFASLYRTGFANQPTSSHVGDGLELAGLRITATVRCAPPQNRPTREEVANCSRWLLPELSRPGLRVVVALGGLAFDQVLKHGPGLGWEVPRPKPRFGHGSELNLRGGPTLLASYHPSQQNTFTGRLRAEMLDGVFERARALAA
ncbi:MAG TPA: uracil-DNA glycosylase [Acidimicrobiia bacterium]